MPKPRIGFVSNIVNGEDKLYYRSLKLASIEKHGLDKVMDVYSSNIQTAEQIVRYCSNNKIKFYRMGSLFPFSSHEILGEFKYLDYFDDQLYELGQLIKVKDIRISMHASEYCVLNSCNPETVKRSIKELNHTTMLMDKLELPKHNKVVIHTGSADGGIENSIKRFVDVFSQLDNSIKNRITLENDDRVFPFSLVNKIFKQTQIPITIDIFHHRIFNPDKIDEIDALKMAIETWNGDVPEVHYSCQSLTNTKKGAHSEGIDEDGLLNFLDKTSDLNFDIMLESKGLNASAEKVIELLGG